MSELIIYNHVIDAPIIDILKEIRYEATKPILADIIDKGDNILVTCPNHSDGQEEKPGCFIYCGNSPDIEYGLAHCFVCDYIRPLWGVVADCLDISDEEGKDWLVDRFGSLANFKSKLLPRINLNQSGTQSLDESILDNFEEYHPYMEVRKLPVELCKELEIKYDPNTQCLVFPVRDRYGKLKFLTRRSVIDKRFLIDKDADKSCTYLLNKVLAGGYKTCIVVESQINAATLWKYGYAAIALFGSGTTNAQMEVLNNTPIRHWLLCYDPDPAGYKGTQRFKKLVRKDVLVDVIDMPVGKDVNDLTDTEIKDKFDKYFNV